MAQEGHNLPVPMAGKPSESCQGSVHSLSWAPNTAATWLQLATAVARSRAASWVGMCRRSAAAESEVNPGRTDDRRHHPPAVGQDKNPLELPKGGCSLPNLGKKRTSAEASLCPTDPTEAQQASTSVESHVAVAAAVQQGVFCRHLANIVARAVGHRRTKEESVLQNASCTQPTHNSHAWAVRKRVMLRQTFGLRECWRMGVHVPHHHAVAEHCTRGPLYIIAVEG